MQVFTLKAVWKSQITKSESKVISPKENLTLSFTGGTPTCGPRLGGTSGPRPTYGHFPKACRSSRVKSLRPFMESPLLLICMRKCKTLWDKWFVNAAGIVWINSDSDNKSQIYLNDCKDTDVFISFDEVINNTPLKVFEREMWHSMSRTHIVC